MSAVLMMKTPASTRLSDERLSWYIWNYEQWYHDEGEFCNTGQGRSTASSITAVSSASEFDGMYLTMRRRCAEAVSALVDSLPAPEKIAFAIKHQDAPVKVFQVRLSLDATYAKARELLRAGLLRRGFV